MERRRLQKLAALTQGLVLVGIGACDNTSAHDPPHINTPAPPTATEQPGGDASAIPQDTSVSAVDAGGPRFPPPHMNAPAKPPPSSKP